ncbi:hypothetical protein GXN76_04430 [Kroppenstedtia pulmonis]|uniref:DUF3955 domain-containing protein n=1 Tax=Kroppenstedtia pulmonis TaxID=1380685 RepID=A0A7D4C5G5_9BACL|nr:hypothetical protein [Kroppenstedtia pulmonis]QKG83796.1 hypothetical protein GXN76_04430 [Kroppenstedtia pulmonis]
MRKSTQSCSLTRNSIWVAAYATGLILVLFGLYFTFLKQSMGNPFLTGDKLLGVLFQTAGGWLLLTGIFLFCITLIRMGCRGEKQS